ncbi:MAG TPA: DUF6448 family protein, partial [Propionibacteriaceae bacterium]|nr:DUF6448 family protein [Propionibacteriaceae bacterium]
MSITTILRSGLSALGRLVVRDASAHCDTEEGPAVTDGRRALATGNANIALKWVRREDEPEVREVFEEALRAQASGGELAEAAERWFLDILVRVHRASEGAEFDGIKPVGTPVPEQVKAADQALADGNLEPVLAFVEPARRAELERRFRHALALKDFDENDLVAARAYMAAYVSFFKFAEGEDHDHHHG